MSEEEETLIISDEDEFEEEEEIDFECPEPDIDFSVSVDRRELIRVAEFNQVIELYNSYVYQYPITNIGDHGNVHFTIPSAFLPLALRSVCGFIVSDTLLEIDLTLKNYRWDVFPFISIKHPVYNEVYVGKSLVNTAVSKFFTPFFKPRETYRAASHIFSADGIQADPDYVRVLMNKHNVDEQSAESALILCCNDLKAAEEYLKTGGETITETKVPVTFQQSPITYFVLEIVEAFLDLSDHCCICRDLLDEPTVRPFACQKEQCQFAFTELGVGTSLIAEIKRDISAAEILVSVFATAFGTNYLTPAPPIKEKSDISKIIKDLPSMCELAKLSSDDEIIKTIGPKSYDLLKWIILSNKSQMISLPKELEMTQFPSQLQFLTLISSIDKERKFQALKKKYGSVYLWHGSSSERWHSIIRNGLKNASGTSMQQNGAALGSGIYFARDIGTSSGYARSCNNGFVKSFIKGPLQIAALCEVAKVPELNDHGWAHTLTNEDACIVRFIFVNFRMNSYDTIANPPKNIPTLSDILDYHAKQK